MLNPLDDTGRSANGHDNCYPHTEQPVPLLYHVLSFYNFVLSNSQTVSKKTEEKIKTLKGNNLWLKTGRKHESVVFVFNRNADTRPSKR